MKVIKLELKNTIGVLNKDVELDFRGNSLISLVGQNGSGKSFLLNMLHPYSANYRYSKRYSVIPNEIGYKRIVFEMDDRTQYDIRHEYTPKGATGHSCKSYIDMITQDGTIIELNPTGNNISFEDIVKQRLNFHNKTHNLVYLNRKKLGFIDNNRNEIIENTYDSQALKKLQKNTTILLRDYKNLADSLEKKSIELAKNFNNTDEDSMRNQLNEILEELKQVTYDFKISEDTIALYKVNINTHKEKYNTYTDKVSLDNAKKFISIFDEIEQTQTCTDLYKIYVNKRNQFNELKNQMLSWKNEYDNINRDIDLYKTNKLYEKELNKQEQLLNELIVELNGRFFEHNKTDFRLIMIDRLQTYLKYLINSLEVYDNIVQSDLDIKYFFKIDLNNIADLLKLSNMIEPTTQKIVEFKTKYEQHIERVENDNIDKEKLCEVPTCKMVLDKSESIKFIEDYKDKYEYANEYLRKIGDIQKSILKYTDDIESFINYTHKDMFSDYFYESNQISNDILSKCKGYNIRDNLINIYESLNDYKYRLKELEEDIRTIQRKITFIDEDSYNDKLNRFKQIENHMKDSTPIIEELKKYAVSNIDIDNLYHNIQNDILIQKVTDVLNSKEFIIKLENKISNLINELKVEQFKCESLKNKREELLVKDTKLRNDIETYNSTLDDIKKALNDKVTLSNLRNIFNKSIPYILTNRALESMEMLVNNIFNEIGINITIRIEVDSNSNINIPCIIDSKEINDIDAISSGESALVATLINACLCKLTGYSILYLDEIDSNLDIENRIKFNKIIDAIHNIIGISQIFIVSHNISQNLNNAITVTLGEHSIINYLNQDMIIKIKEA